MRIKTDPIAAADVRFLMIEMGKMVVWQEKARAFIKSMGEGVEFEEWMKTR